MQLLLRYSLHPPIHLCVLRRNSAVLLANSRWANQSFIRYIMISLLQVMLNGPLPRPAEQTEAARGIDFHAIIESRDFQAGGPTSQLPVYHQVEPAP